MVLAFETTIVSSLMDLSGTIGHADPTMLHKRNHSGRLRWLMHKIRSMLRVVVHKNPTVCV